MNLRKLRYVALLGGVAAFTPALAQRAALPPSGEVHVTKDPSRVWGELQIAVNPKNPNNILYVIHGHRATADCVQRKDPACELVEAKIVGITLHQPRGFFIDNAGFNIQTVFASFDRGKTWQRYKLPPHPAGFPRLTSQGDPSVTVGPDGTFYASWDANNWGTPENMIPEAGVGISKSTDGGKTWSPPSLTRTPTDAPKLVVDASTGVVYAASSSQLGPRSTGDPNAPLGKITTRWVSSSKDGVTWTDPQPMGGQGGSTSAAHGLLATAFTTSGTANVFSQPNNDLCGTAPAPCTIFQTTSDAGATWQRHPMPATAQGGAAVAADPSKKGHFAVALPMKRGMEMHVYETFDAGQTWQGPVLVADDATKAHYHITLAYSPDGVLGMFWRTRHPQETSAPAATGVFGERATPYDAWAAVSRDGGTTFSQPMRLSSGISPASPNRPFAHSGDDYSGMAMDREYLYAGWADWRAGERGGYFRAVKFTDFKPK